MTLKTTSSRVLIPVETKTRELSAKLFLSTVLADRGYDVYLGNKIQHTALDKIDPDVYFETSAKDHEDRFEMLQENGIKTLVLETEGSAFSGAGEFTKLLGSETLRRTDCYCAWGAVAKEAVETVNSNTRVELTGNPRFDLLQKPHRMFYSDIANQLQQEYGEFILFNTNFSISNGENPASYTLSNVKNDSSEKEYISEVLKKQTKIFGEFLRLIAETAEEFPDRNIIVRPHPGENPSFYENGLYAHDNIFVEKRLEVRPWIMAAKAVVHNSCTTGVTSALLDTPVLAYVPDGLEALSTPNEVSDRCESLTELHDNLRGYLSHEMEFSLNNQDKDNIKNHIDNVDYLSVERIADVVDSVTSTEVKRTRLTTDNKLRLRRLLVQAVGAKRFEELYVRKFRGENRHKFPYTPTTEVDSIVDRFVDEIKPTGLQVQRVPYMVNGFRLSTNV